METLIVEGTLELGPVVNHLARQRDRACEVIETQREVAIALLSARGLSREQAESSLDDEVYRRIGPQTSEQRISAKDS